MIFESGIFLLSEIMRKNTQFGFARMVIVGMVGRAVLVRVFIQFAWLLTLAKTYHSHHPL
jgi:uncharacterized membrane protein YeaQ/YmgE (transglycosylase-associated protein family)